MKIMDIYRRFVPEKIKMRFHYWKQDFLARNFMRKLFNYYEKKQLTEDEEQVINYLKKNKTIPVIPYDFTSEYKRENIEVYFDKDNGLKYVIFKGKKLYFKRSWSEDAIRRIFNFLLIEQDYRSPHYYVSDKILPEIQEVIADVGAAEGIFTLDNIEKISKAFLFECDDEWIEALQCTFAPWNDKITIVKKFVSDNDSFPNISLSSFFLNNEIDFIKIDVDGSESKLITGARDLFNKTKKLKIVICTYHNQDDHINFKKYFESLHPQVLETSQGFMIFREDQNQKPPFLRRGVLRIKL